MTIDNYDVLTVEDLDLGVAERHAFGSLHSYAKPKNLSQVLEVYWNGQLILPPHPAWTGDPTDWTADPFTDKNWQFQHHTLRWLNPLRWAAINGDKRARFEWNRVVRSWVERNIPASVSSSPYAWKDMADGNRAIQLSLGAPLVPADAQWFVMSLEYHRDWLLDESNIVGKNHGLHQHAGLLVVGAVLRDSAAVKTAISRMTAQFETTFDSQGTNDEGSVSYQQMNIIWWRQAWARVQAEGIVPPKHVTKLLDKASNVLAHFAMPNGQLPQIGDAARGKIASGHSPETDYVATAGKNGRSPKETTMILDRGYIVSRSGWGESRPLALESHTLIRHGKELRSHSHRDRGSVHIYADGQRWLIDSGFHSYRAAAPENRYLVSRAAHNVADVINVKHNPNADVELVDSKITPQFHDFTLLDHGYGSHSMKRRVTYVTEADCWVVSDRAGGVKNYRISQRWHIEPGVSTRRVDRGFRLAIGKKRFWMTWLGQGTKLSRVHAEESSLDAWIGTKWRPLTPGNRIVVESSAARPHIVGLFSAEGTMPLGIVDSRVTAAGRIELHIVRGDRQWRILIDEVVKIRSL